MARTIIDVPDTQLGEVDDLCRSLGISRAEAVRRALRDFVRDHRHAGPDGFGLWKNHAAEVQRALQRRHDTDAGAA